MKTIKHDFGNDKKVVKIINFSDIHIGSPKCDISLVKHYIDKVANDPDMYCVFGGDLLQNAIKSSVSSVYEQTMSPMKQLRYAIDIFSPISHKALAVVSGNHERRSTKEVDADLTWVFADELGVGHLYDYASCVLFLRFGKMGHNYGGNGHSGKTLYTMLLQHGDGIGGRTAGGRVNGLERRAKVISGCDVIWTGHTHNIATFKESNFYIDKGNSSVKQFETTFVSNGSFLDYETYAELYGMPPTVKGSPVVMLSGEKHKNVSVLV